MALLAAIARDIAELVRAGYPEETARRIATGDLPMDTASRMERARQLGYDPDDVQYHGTSDDILAFRDTLLAQRDPGYVGQGVYTTSEPRLASSYANMAVPRERNAAGDFSGPNVMPLLTRGDEFQQFSLQDKINLAEEIRQNPLAAKALTEQLSDAGKAGAEVRDATGALVERVTFDPRNVRSLLSAAFDPEYTGPNILGGAALPVVGGLLAAGQSEEADAGFVTRGGKTLLEAWHGSPHKFDRFSMDHIGTGEGAQAYGRGLYFAEAEEVGKGYRDALSDYSGFTTKSGIPIKDSKKYGEWGAYINELYRQGKSSEEIAKLMRSSADKSLASPFKQEQARGRRAQKLADEIESGKVSYKSTGSLYTVDIDVDPDELLDYDIPLSEQSDFVKEALKKIPRGDVKIEPHPLREDRYKITGTNWRGGKVNRQAVDLEQAERIAAKARGIDLDLEGDLRGGALIERAPYEQQEGLANMLREAGIKGIKYLDRDSRFVSSLDSGKDLTSNYVIFDDSLINIAERGSADPRLLGGTALGTAGILSAIAAGDRNDTAMAAAPRSDTLQDITMGLRGVERRLRGSPASLLFPEGVVNYLEAVNRPYEDPTAVTRAMALLDLL